MFLSPFLSTYPINIDEWITFTVRQYKEACRGEADRVDEEVFSVDDRHVRGEPDRETSIVIPIYTIEPFW